MCFFKYLDSHICRQNVLETTRTYQGHSGTSYRYRWFIWGYHLDALFVVTNAPGRSAFNRVERRMAPLTKELVGFILPQAFGTHLDQQGKTIDADLERQSFTFASGKTLAAIWFQLVIDHSTHSEYISPDKSEFSECPYIQEERHRSEFSVYICTYKSIHHANCEMYRT